MKPGLINTLFATDNGLAGLALRVPAGIIFAAHGAQKLFGAFGGYGLEGTGQWMASIGLEPGYLMALAAGSAEFFGGLALLVGLLTRPAALVLAVTMLVAILSVHLPHGLFMSNNGYEFGLSLFAIALALLFNGGGAWSLDRVVVGRLNGGARSRHLSGVLAQ
ncbi:DoxX family protein [Ketobacter sp.]|uniref:DoxX family protein n=1 Tax=Ketobacter sp. TaxID=2083498 RepID=UPI000F2A08F2|nr:DoxX family protein [Ketobacter sp.]RLT98013.1 MAG: DoxX family protein [Ketobacter sp.]